MCIVFIYSFAFQATPAVNILLHYLITRGILILEPVDRNLTEEVDTSIAGEEIVIKSGGTHDTLWESYETSKSFITY